MDNILTSLGAGSGIDVKLLVQQLTEADRAPRLELLNARQARIDARISALGQYRSALDALVSALGSRVSGGTLSGIPQVSDPSILTMRVDPGTIVARQTLEVRQIARAQTLASAPVADPQAAVGQGSITIRFGTVAGTAEATGFQPAGLADLAVPVGSGTSLSGLRDAINDAAAVAGAPVQAQVVADADGSRLVLRGSSGVASGFVVETSGDASLESFAFVPGGTTGLGRTQYSTDAEIALDGVVLRRPSNIVNDLVPGARLALGRAAPGSFVTIAADRDPAELTAVVTDIAAALNELALLGRELTRGGGATGSAGALVSDSATRRAVAGLPQLLSKPMLQPAGNSPARLSDLGISISRDGNFTVDEARLQRAVANHPASIEALVTALNRPASPGNPAGPLRALSENFRSAAAGSPGSPRALDREAAEIARQRTLLDVRTERSRELLTRQYAALDRAVGQSKALQSFLTQQIDLWTNRNNR